MKEGLYSNNFVKDLLMLEVLQNTDSENPKTAKQIADEIEKLWNEHEFLKNIPFNDKDKPKSEKVSATITRHIHDLNKSGLYDIKTCDEKKKGYYNKKVKNFISDTPEHVSKKIEENFIFSSAEFAVIAMALYRTPSISTEETQQILNKFKNLMAPEGESFNYFLQKQIEYWKGIRRKPARKILPIISELLNAIINRKQIRFKMYDRNFSTEQKYIELERKIQKSRDGGKRDKIFTVSPYFFAWDNDECYLICAESDNEKNFEDDIYDAEDYKLYEGSRYLTHFKVSLIGNLKILEDVEAEHLIVSSELAHYALSSASPYRNIEEKDGIYEICELVLKKIKGKNLTVNEEKKIRWFSLDRYSREHIYMESNNSRLLKVTIYFKENFLDKVLTQFGINQEYELIPNRNENDEFKYQSRIIVQDNDGLYRWLMKYSDQVKVIRPLNVLEKLKRRYEEALKNLNL